MSRKTVPVSEIKAEVNMMLRDSVDEVIEGRIAIAVLLEKILMSTGNYHGFGYLPGVIEDGNVTGDETRRIYY